MRHFRLPPLRPSPLPRALACGALLAGLLACERGSRAPAVESTRAAPRAAAPARGVAATASGWVGAAGRYLLVPGPTPGVAWVIDPERRDPVGAGDSVAIRLGDDAPAALFTADGTRLAARVAGPAAPPADDLCALPWPAVQLAEAGSALAAWDVGFVGDGGAPLPLDSLPALASADSASLASAAARLASSLPVRDEAYFRGLPFALHSAWRFSPAPGTQAFAALLVRRVSQEDAPIEERTFLVAEREGDGAWQSAYHERSTGTEDDVASSHPMAALRVGDRPLLVLVRELPEGLSYRLLVRDGAAAWRAAWTSAVGKCE